MTIKKPMKVKPMGAGAPASAGGAAIADRFKLDMTAQPAQPTNDKGTTVAGAFGLIALAVVGILTYILWKHWEFLMPA